MTPTSMWETLELPYVDWEVPVCGGGFHLLCVFLFSFVRAQLLLQPTEVDEGVEMGMMQLDPLLCISAPFHQENDHPAGWEVQADYQWPSTSPQERKLRRIYWGKNYFDCCQLQIGPTPGLHMPIEAEDEATVVKDSVKEYKCTFVY